MPKPTRPAETNPPLAAEEVDRLERILKALLDLRIADNDKEFRAARDGERWSQVAGLHGIGTGLLIARRLIEDEFKSLRTNAAASAA